MFGDAQELSVGAVVLIDPEHELEPRRISEGEAHVGFPLFIEPSRRIYPAPLIGGRERLAEVAKAEQCHLREQPFGILKMVRRSRGRNTNTPRRLAQREAVDAVFFDDPLRGSDELPT